MMLFSYSTSCTARLKASLYTLTPSRKFPLSRQSVTCCLCQIQGDKEKLLYELDSVQAELEKCRMISERWTKQYFSLHNIFNSLNIYLDSKNILLLRLFFPGCRRRRRTLWRTSTARGSSMTSCRWANFFVFFPYDLRKLFSFISLWSEETFLSCFFKIWGNFFSVFFEKEYDRRSETHCFGLQSIDALTEYPFPTSLSLFFPLSRWSIFWKRQCPPEICGDPLKMKESGTQVCHACDLLKTFGEKEKLGNCCLVMDCLLVWDCQCQGQGNYGGAPR